MKEDQERTPLRTILQNFINHIESLETERIDDSYEKEFQELKFFSEILKTSKQYHCSEGEKEVNRKKNRYKDILPFDTSRVILEEYVGVPGSDYINANFIKGASGSPAYIASQGPLPHTVNDFWRMVVECEVQVIVMACNQEEAGKHKCENYWVEHEGEEKQFGMVTIRLLKASIVCPDFLVRTMLLKYTNGRATTEERTVCQFHYSAWPDHGVPPLVRPLLDMVRLVRDTQASETLPVLVHCSAGCGRTGTICAIDYVFGLLRAGKLTKDFSLYTLVRDMRKQRIAMVQTKEQYVLVHQAVRELFCEQLRMIDAHPYENIDANGMPLIKEPMYDTINSCSTNQEENAEKQDGKEKELGVATSIGKEESDVVRAPPLPHKKKLHVAASKQEKEVENLTEKRRCTVEHSSGSDSGSVSSGMGSLLSRPRIAKLKALFERNSSSRESRNDRGRRHGSQQVTRSHSLGPVRKGEVDAGNPTVWRPIPGGGILRVPQLSAPKPALPVKRSKSLRVMGSGERQTLSVMVDSSCDVVLVKSINPPSVSDKKPSVPPKALLTNRDVDTSDYLGTQARTRRDGMLQQQACGIDQRGNYSQHQGCRERRSYENVPAPLRRRHSLESVILEDVPTLVEVDVPRQADYVNVRTPKSLNETKSQTPSNYMDKGARKLLQDCRDYLVNSFHPSSQNVSKSINGNSKQIGKPNEDQLKHLSLEAQRKVKAIVAGLGVRERRNSFRQAVDTSRDPGRVRDYEPIWPGGSKAGTSGKDIARALPIAYVPLPIQHNKGAYHPHTDLHKVEETSNPKPSPGKTEQAVYRNHDEERTQLYQKPPDDRFKFLNHSVKSLAQKGSGSLRVKGTQVLAFSREHDMDTSGGLQPYKNLAIKKTDSFEATKEHRYNSPPQPGSAHVGRTYTDTRAHPRNNPSTTRGSSDQQRPSTGSDQSVYVKRTSPDERLLFQDPKTNGTGISPLSKDAYIWSGHMRRGEPSSSKKEPTKTPEQSKPRSSGTIDKLSPRVNLQSSSNNLLANSSSLFTVGSSRNVLKVGDPRATRQAQEIEEHQRRVLRQTPRGPVQPRKPDGTILTGPILGQGRADQARTTTISSPRADLDGYEGMAAGFQQMRPGSQDDLALCPNAPPRVRRRASVVLLRRSLQETAAPLTVWNDAADTWAAGTGVDVDAVAASIKRQPAGDQSATLARALESLHLRRASQRNAASDMQGFTPPSLPVKKQHYL